MTTMSSTLLHQAPIWSLQVHFADISPSPHLHFSFVIGVKRKIQTVNIALLISGRSVIDKEGIGNSDIDIGIKNDFEKWFGYKRNINVWTCIPKPALSSSNFSIAGRVPRMDSLEL
mmetsp:Transcript_23685/g.50096  ORF Transcript_23685/g.50096 Transcript_23685/m.50096 type:complete len:116 (-) Transcript_23685:248-595(-)